jgi:hypothetical protein
MLLKEIVNKGLAKDVWTVNEFFLIEKETRKEQSFDTSAI